jgi:polyketide synthase 12
VVISGAAEAVDRMAGHFTEAGLRTRTLPVSHAFHSPLMEPMLARFAEVAAGLPVRPPRVPVVSNVTGAVVAAEEICAPGYWVRQARETVRFADGMATLAAAGVTTFLELGPDGVLTAMAQECLDASGGATAVAALRRGQPEPEALLAGVMGAHVSGVAVDWPAVFAGTGARRVDLPTYAFQRRRYWPDDAEAGSGDLAATGLRPTGHPLLRAQVASASSGEVLFTGQLSRGRQRWLADHAVLDTVIFPGAGFVELALWAGARLGAGSVDELTLRSPLVLPEQGDVPAQVVVGAADDAGRRPVTVHSRSATTNEWITHAEGTLVPEAPTPQPGAGPVAWPPDNAEPVELADFYERLLTFGFDYGPAFRGLAAAWRRGDEVFAEVRLPEQMSGDAAAFGIHPALLDATLHALALVVPDRPSTAPAAGPRLPFTWRGVRLYRGGATTLRVRLVVSGPDTIAVDASDSTGLPVASVEALALREISAEQVRRAGGRLDGLFRVTWSPAPDAVPGTGPAGRWAVIDTDSGYPDLGALCADLDAGGTPPDVVVVHAESAAPDGGTAAGVRTAVRRALDTVRGWLDDERFAAARLVFCTRRAVEARDGDGVGDPAHAAVWGLVRSAQLENPDRLVLVDLDADGDARRALPDAVALALSAGEPQIAVRGGRLLVPRLTRTGADDPAPPDPAPWPDTGTVLITGATGQLGALVARHLVAAHGVRHLLLVSRRGADAPGAPDLRRELAGRGASVRLAACDVADRTALADLLAGIPAEHPLSAVVHAAGVVADGTLGSLTDDQVDRVLRAKVDGLVNLHDLTAGNGLAEFVVFSSLAGTLGGAGQANYAAANAFADALCRGRRADGLPARALAWGPWEPSGGMTAELREADLNRIARSGLRQLTAAEGLELFDAARSSGEAALCLFRLDTATLAAGAAGEAVPVMVRGLLRTPRRRSDEPEVREARAALRDRLQRMSGDDRTAALVDLVRTEAAAVAGLPSTEAVSAGKPFRTLGFDSLMAVDLRNRLTAVTGARLPATLVFDHPTPAALADHLHTELAVTAVADTAPALLAIQQLETAVRSMAPTDGSRGAMANRLRVLLADLTDADDPDEGQDGRHELESANAEELVSMIADEFGIR